jgi:CDP-diacylglycerol--serine O-phosphatidyltransferase
LLRFLNAANAVTLCGLAAAVFSALLAAEGRLPAALIALIVSGLCDLFDGFVARKLQRTDEEKAFGAHLDSAVDACSFAVAPAVLLWGLGLRSAPERALLVFFACCAVWRLAYFDTVGLAPGDDPGRAAKYYTGVPTTYTALVLPLAALAGFAGAGALRVAAGAAALGLALAMVSPFKIRKPGGAWYAIFLALAVVMIGVYAACGARFAAAAP